MKKTIKKLREEFEGLQETRFLSLDRNSIGEYGDRTTFLFWGGFFTCALKNNLIAKEEADHKNKNN